MNDEAVQHVKQIVLQQGRMPFPEFMREALYGPFGYYSQSVQIGGAGADFYTASRLPLFGWTIANAIERRWQGLGCPKRLQLIEFGAGQGELAEFILDALQSRALDVVVEYVIMDVSQRLITMQRQRLQRFDTPTVRVRWQTPDFTLTSILIANEVLDALVVERVQRIQGGWLRGWVENRADRFVMSWVEADEALSSLASRWLPILVGSQAELCTEFAAFFERCKGLAAQLTVLFFDYGITMSELETGVRPNGTLRGYLKHELVDPLQSPGACDITADVHWDYAVHCAEEAGFKGISLQTQGTFLMKEGILNALEHAWEKGDEQSASKLNGQFKQLALPGGMGERFMVMECHTY